MAVITPRSGSGRGGRGGRGGGSSSKRNVIFVTLILILVIGVTYTTMNGYGDYSTLVEDFQSNIDLETAKAMIFKATSTTTVGDAVMISSSSLSSSTNNQNIRPSSSSLCIPSRGQENCELVRIDGPPPTNDDETSSTSTSSTTTTTINFASNRNLLRSYLNEFVEVYAKRPEKDNICGIRFNHAMALYVTVKELKPETVIESGVNSGVSTWFIRQASSTVKIISIDPEDKPICDQPNRWLDDTKDPITGNLLQERYLGKDKFVDFTKIDWNKKIYHNELNPKTTLIYIDDHLPFFPRVATFLKYNFQHVMLEDNYKLGQGATNGDKWGTPKQLFMGGKKPRSVPQDGQWLLDNLIQYHEFPPFISPKLLGDKINVIPQKSQGGFLHLDVDPIHYESALLDETNVNDLAIIDKIMNRLELDRTFTNTHAYTELLNYCFIVYMEFKPMSPTLMKEFPRVFGSSGGAAQ